MCFYSNSQRCSKIMELEEELKVVGNSLKSLEVSEEKVSFSWFRDFRGRSPAIDKIISLTGFD